MRGLLVAALLAIGCAAHVTTSDGAAGDDAGGAAGDATDCRPRKCAEPITSATPCLDSCGRPQVPCRTNCGVAP